MSGTSARINHQPGSFIDVNEGAGVGTVLRRQDRTDYNPIGDGSLDMSVGDSDLIPRGYVGQQSYGNGYNILGDGYAGIYNGWDNRNNGNYCVANGISIDTFGGGCVVVGEALSNQGGDKMGIFGRANTLPTGNPYGLQVGNGTVSSTGPRVLNAVTRSDAFRVYRSGVIEAPSCTNALIDTIGDNALITNKWYKGQNKYRFVTPSISRVNQTTIELMNQQISVVDPILNFPGFEEYLTINFTADKTDNYVINLDFIYSLNSQGRKFLAVLDIVDGVNQGHLTMAIEPKDASGVGIPINIVQAGVVIGNANTGTDARYPASYRFNKSMIAGTTYTIRLLWGCGTANLEPTIYQGNISVQQKEAI